MRIGAIATCYMALNIIIASPFFLLQPHLWDFDALRFAFTYEIDNEEQDSILYVVITTLIFLIK